MQHDAGSKLAATIRYSQFARATGVSLAHLVGLVEAKWQVRDRVGDGVDLGVVQL